MENEDSYKILEVGRSQSSRPRRRLPVFCRLTSKEVVDDGTNTTDDTNNIEVDEFTLSQNQQNLHENQVLQYDVYGNGENGNSTRSLNDDIRFGEFTEPTTSEDQRIRIRISNIRNGETTSKILTNPKP